MTRIENNAENMEIVMILDNIIFPLDIPLAIELFNVLFLISSPKTISWMARSIKGDAAKVTISRSMDAENGLVVSFVP